MASEVKSDRDHGAGDSNRIRNSHSDGDLRCGQYEGILYPDMTDKNQQQPEDVAAERPVTIAIAVNNSSQQRPTSMHRTLSNARDCIYGKNRCSISPPFVSLGVSLGSSKGRSAD